MKCVDFYDFLNKHDIIMMTETKLDEIDDLTFPGFKLITKNRKFKKRVSGGVAILIREELEYIISVLNVEQQDSIWLKFKSDLKNDLILCVIYIPPENSAYSKISMFDNLEEIITDLRIKYNNIDVCIMGNLNARTGNASDVLEMSQDEIELIDGYVPLENINIPGNRVSFDNTVNSYGTRLLTLCKSLYMFILNGRMGNDAQVGRTTC